MEQSTTEPIDVIPYARPAAASAASGCWQEGRILVARKDAHLPPRCVLCNAPDNGQPLKRTYAWHNPALYLTILLGVLVYAIIALVVQQKAVVYIHLCKRHRAMRNRMILLGWIGGLGGILTIILGAANRLGVAVTVGIVAFLVGLICAIRTRVLTPNRIDANFMWLRGASPEFLEALDRVPAAAPIPVVARVP